MTSMSVLQVLQAQNFPLPVMGCSFPWSTDFLAFLEAGLTQPVFCFGSIYTFLHHISKRCSSNTLQLIILLFNIPTFNLHHFFFTLAYSIGQFHLTRLGRKCVALGGEDYSVHFNGFDTRFFTDVERQKFFRDGSRRLNSLKGQIETLASDIGNILPTRVSSGH